MCWMMQTLTPEQTLRDRVDAEWIDATIAAAITQHVIQAIGFAALKKKHVIEARW